MPPREQLLFAAKYMAPGSKVRVRVRARVGVRVRARVRVRVRARVRLRVRIRVRARLRVRVRVRVSASNSRRCDGWGRGQPGLGLDPPRGVATPQPYPGLAHAS